MNPYCQLPLLGAALLLGAAPVVGHTAALDATRGVYAETQYCCGDVWFHIDRRQGANSSYVANSWSAQASVNAALDYGAISAHTEAYGNANGYVYVNAVSQARDYWVDTFTISSATLAAGTPVELRLGVNLNASLQTSGFGKGSALAVIGTGLDAGWLTGVDTQVVGDGAHSAYYSLATQVGGVVTLVGQLKTRAWAEGPYGLVRVGSAATDAAAVFTADVLTPGASLAASSGHFYGTVVSNVPEPQAWVLLLAGTAALACLRRRRP